MHAPGAARPPARLLALALAGVAALAAGDFLLLDPDNYRAHFKEGAPCPVQPCDRVNACLARPIALAWRAAPRPLPFALHHHHARRLPPPPPPPTTHAQVNESTFEWARDNLPFLDTGDADVVAAYYYRAKTYKSHLMATDYTDAPWVVSEYGQ